VSQRIERYRDIEVVFQFADQLEDLEGVESEIRKQLARPARFNRPPADALQDFDDVAFDGFSRWRLAGVLRRAVALGLGNFGQSRNVT
jgi:hypothetical protein